MAKGRNRKAIRERTRLIELMKKGRRYLNDDIYPGRLVAYCDPGRDPIICCKGAGGLR